MAEHSHIQWTGATWNPVVGCRKVSPGCDSCYAIRDAHRLAGNPNPKVGEVYAGLTQIQNGRPNWTGVVRCAADRLETPLRWRKPQAIFVNSMSDLFHADVPDEFIAAVFGVMAACPRHTFQVLTKRPERLAQWFQWYERDRDPRRYRHPELIEHAAIAANSDLLFRAANDRAGQDRWPLPNVWLGTSVEDQRRADERIPHLLQVPARVRFLSCEPLLAAVDLTNIGGPHVQHDALTGEYLSAREKRHTAAIDWVIAGGESGPRARPLHPDWARSLRDQCQAAGVPFFWKQWGEWAPLEQLEWTEPEDLDRRQHFFCDGLLCYTTVFRVGKKNTGRLLDGVEWSQFPETSHA